MFLVASSTLLSFTVLYIAPQLARFSHNRRGELEDNIALLVTNEDVDFNDHIQPVCPPEQNYEQAEGAASGYGHISSGFQQLSFCT